MTSLLFFKIKQMALVKKLQSGGTVQDDKYNKFLEEYGKSVKKNSYQNFSNSARQLQDIYKKEGIEGLKNAFEFDDVAKTYKVVHPALQDWKGLPEGESVKKDLFGKVKLDSKEAANSLLSHLTQEFIKNNPQDTPKENVPETVKETYSPSDLGTEILNRRFDKNENQFATSYNAASNEDRWKKYITPTLLESIAEYKTAGQGVEHKYLNELNQIESLLKTPNFDKNKIIDLLNQTGQNTTSLFRSKEEQDKLDSTVKETTDVDKLKQSIATLTEKLNKFGITNPEVLTNFVGAGFTEVVDDFKSKTPWLDKYIASNKGVLSVLRNPTTNTHIIIDKNGQFHNKTFNDPNNPEYFGKVLTVDKDAQGRYGYFAEDAAEARRNKRPGFEAFDQPIGRGYKASAQSVNFKLLDNKSLPAFLQNPTSIVGTPTGTKPNTAYRNVFGELDYQKTLEFTVNGKKVILRKNPDNTYGQGRYKIPLKTVSLNEYLKPFNATDYGVSDDDIQELDLNAVNNLMRKQNLTPDEKASLVKWSYNKLNSLTNKELAKSIRNKYMFREPQTLKNGGSIQKMLYGGASRVKKVEQIPVKEDTKSLPMKGHRLSDFNSTNALLEKADMAANALALAPGGFGVLGGLASTGIEAYQDYKDDNNFGLKDFGNLALNLGLTGASFVGLGSLRNVAKGSKIAGKFKKVDNLIKVAEDVKGGDKYLDALKTLKQSGVKTIDLASEEEHAVKAKEFAEILSKNQFIHSPSFKNVLSKTSNKIVNVANKTGLYVAGANVVLNAEDALNASKKLASGNTEDLTTTDINSLLAVGLGLKIAGRSAKMAIGKKYGTVPGTSTEASITADLKGKSLTNAKGEPIVLEGKLADDFDKMSLKSFKEKIPFVQKKPEIKKAFLEKYNEGLEDASKLKIEDLKGLNIKYNKASKSDFNLREKNSYSMDQNLWLQRKGSKWAKKYKLASPKLETEKVVTTTENVATPKKETLYDTFKRVRDESNVANKPKLQKGGILKGQYGFKYDPKIKSIYNVRQADPKTWTPNKLKFDKITVPPLATNVKPDLAIPQLSVPKTSFNNKIATNNTNNTNYSNNYVDKYSGLRDVSGKLISGLNENKDILTDLGMYFATNASNKKIGDIQRSALAKTLLPTTILPKTYLSTAIPITQQYDKQATNIERIGRNLSNSTSNLNPSYQLEAGEKAANIRLQGQTAKAGMLKDIQDRQVGINSETDRINLGNIQQTRASNANVMKDIALVGASEEQINNFNLKRLVDSTQEKLANNNAKKQYFGLQKDIIGSYKDPNYMANVKNYQDLVSNYENTPEYKEWKNLDDRSSLKTKTFEESNQYNKLKNRISILSDSIKSFKEGIDMKQYALNTGLYQQPDWKTGILAKGGTLDNKYKQLLKDQEYLQKSMIKIFK